MTLMVTLERIELIIGRLKISYPCLLDERAKYNNYYNLHPYSYLIPRKGQFHPHGRFATNIRFHSVLTRLCSNYMVDLTGIEPATS